MCGICGIYNFDGRPVGIELLKRMNLSMIHRGPDDEGYFVNAGGPEGREAGKPGDRVAHDPSAATTEELQLPVENRPN